jgi:hypothetical protein
MSDAEQSRTDEEGVLDANRAFYRVFSAGDIAAMRRLWSSIEPLQCIHPGEPAIHGREAILESWSSIFDGGGPTVSPSRERASIIRGVGFVTCLETLPTGVLAATNVFVWEDEVWKLVHHQAGPLAVVQQRPVARPDGRLH